MSPEANESRTSHRVVVALTDGKRERGFVYNFSPNAPSFYLFPSETEDASFARLVESKECKAIYFVKSHEGNKAYREAMRKAPEDPRPRKFRGHKMRITFSDGEEMVATTENYNPVRLGFFVYPVDPRSNNLRIFVINANVRQVTTGQAIQESRAPAAVQARHAKAEPPRSPPRRAPAPAAGPAPGRPAGHSPPAPDLPPPSSDDSSIPLEKRIEAVLRVIAGETPSEVSGEMEIPAGVLAHWAQVFLAHGRRGLSGETTPAEDSRSSLVAELTARVRTLEAELARLRAIAGRAAQKR